ncbi:MAG: extracellular solute-binding protein [Candidatus Paceibacterota bacterium]
MSNFQIVLLGVFIFFIVVGVITFAFLSGNNSDVAGQEVVIWGTLSADIFSQITQSYYTTNQQSLRIKYFQKDANTFDKDFTEALASGKGPDVVLIPHNLIVRHQDKIMTIPSDSYSFREYKDTFFDGGEIFLNSEGSIALPFIVDPLVMYWNKTLFSNAGITEPPKIWDELSNLSGKLTNKNSDLVISQSAVALGEFKNITNAKDILSLLILQAGNPITVLDNMGQLTSVLNSNFKYTVSPAVAALNFYTQFADPSRNIYSWNKSLPSSQDAFVGGKLAIYFGYASELNTIREKNPNLDFDVASIPQVRDAKTKLTYGKIQGLAILKSSKKTADDFNEILILVGKSMQQVVGNTGLPPVRRDLLGVKPSDPYLSVFYDSAIISKAWLDPNPQETSAIFQNMVESITSGKQVSSDAVDEASQAINILLGK